MGYKTWNDYCVKEFGNQHIAIPREDRNEVVGSLRDAGLSVRAISGATGLGVGTVSRSITASSKVDSGSGVPNGTPDDKPQKGLDGKAYNRSTPKPKPRSEESTPRTLDGQSDISDELDTSLEDLGITPISATEVIDKNAKARVQNVKRLTGANGQYAQAPLPMVINLAGQIVETTAGAQDLDVEEITSLADDSSRAVLVLARMLETIDPDEIDDDKTRLAIEQNLNQAQEYLDNFLTTLTEV